MARSNTGETEGVMVYLGVIGTVVIYNLLRSRPLTRAAEMPSTTPPEEFNNLAEVAKRFDEVKTLYRAGVLGFQDTRDQIAGLIDTAFELETSAKAESGPVADLVEQMAAFHDDTFRAEQDIARSDTIPA